MNDSTTATQGSAMTGPKRVSVPVLVGLAGLLLASIFAARVLDVYGWDPTGVARFSRASQPYAEERLGRAVIVAPAAGHDGKFFFALANDPWLQEPEVTGGRLDDPPYRAGRILYPLLAGGFGLLGPGQVIWGLIVVNVLALGLGTYFTAGLARRYGLSAWYGLAFVMNPGMLYELTLDGSSIVGWALAAGGVYALDIKRWGLGATLLALGALSRETMILVALGCGVFLFLRGDRRRGIQVVAVPAAAAGVWAVYTRVRLAAIEPAFSSLERNLSAPLTGLSRVAGEWFDGLDADAMLGALLIGSAVLVILAAIRRPSLLSWSTAGFAVLFFFLDEVVVDQFVDSTRVVAPMVTAAVLLGVVMVRTPAGRQQKALT